MKKLEDEARRLAKQEDLLLERELSLEEREAAVGRSEAANEFSRAQVATLTRSHQGEGQRIEEARAALEEQRARQLTEFSQREASLRAKVC